MKARTVRYLGILLVIPLISGCWLLAAGGAGAYGGYKAKEEGYELRNPVTKDKTERTEAEEKKY